MCSLTRKARSLGRATLTRCLFALLVVVPVGVASAALVDDKAERFLAGRLLVASADMGDPNFARTVIYMVQHDRTGALGLVVNNPIGEAPIDEILAALGADAAGKGVAIKVYSGGPVDPSRGFVLHSTDVLLSESKDVDGHFAVTTRPEMLRAIAEGKGPKRALFILGYAGWAPGQLEAEIAAGAWETVPPDEALVFEESDETKWERAISRHSIDL